MLSVQSVGVRHGSVSALADATFHVDQGQRIGLIGPNGSGKTTLLKVLGGLLRPSSGRVLLDNRSLELVRPKERARRIAYVGQDEQSQMPFTARETLLLGRSARHHDWGNYNAEDYEVVEKLLWQFGLGELADRTLDRMSGGERQRVLIARALAQEAPIVLLDEPTNHLDVKYQHHVLDVVTAADLTSVVVLHDLNHAAAYCDRLLLLERGVLVADGSPAEVLDHQRVADVYGVRTRRLDICERPHLILGR
jgi:iron complex transport system ATP-binding protein